MKEEFKSLCDKLISENEIDLKKERNEIKNRSKKSTGPAIGLVIFGIIAYETLFYTPKENNNSIIMFIIGITSILLCFICIKMFPNNNGKGETYNEIYQNKIIKPLMKLFYHEPYLYTPNIGMPREFFEKIELRRFDRYMSTNLISGTIQNCPFTAANVLAEKESKNYFAGRNEPQYSYVTIFSGLLMKIELQKPFNDFMYLTKRKNIEKIKNKTQKTKLEEYKINMQENFDIYASNDEFAKKILTDDILRKLSSYYNISNSVEICEVVINENCIYIMAPGMSVPGTDIILYNDKESMSEELFRVYEKFDYLFELVNMLINKLS